MPKRRNPPDPIVAAGPSEGMRERVLAFLAEERRAALEAGRPAPSAVTKRDIARALEVKGNARLELKRVLRDLEAEGTHERPHRRNRRDASLPGVLPVDIVGRDGDGDLLAGPAVWDSAAQGAPPRILVDVPRRGHGPAPGVGDRVLVRLEPAPGGKPGGPTHVGRVLKLLPKTPLRALGVLRDAGTAGLRIMPVDKKNAATEFAVPAEFRAGAADGDLVAFEAVGRGHAIGLPVARIVERLGSVASERAISLIAIEAHGIPHEFGPEALAEAAAVRLPTTSGREDWRTLPLVTIDPADARDHDDAVHAAPDDAPDNPGGFLVTVAIADVAALVRPGTALDREALARGNSVYFPDRVVPMLPERLSADLGSLRPHEDRAALAVRLQLGADGRKRSHTVHRVLMRSHARLTYEQAQAAIDGRPDDVTGPLLDELLSPLYAAYAAARQARDARAPLDLDLPERRVLLKADGTVDRVVVPARLDAHRLIEEFMILANVAAAETLEAHRQPLIYRVHEEPSVEKIVALADFLATLGIKLAKGQVLRPAAFNGILARVRGTDNEHVVNEVVLRTQAQAVYAAENAGHFGLNLRRYAHFTSPIRRYADLIVHRALIRARGLGEDGLPDTTVAALAEIGTRISGAERRAMAAERDTLDRLIAAHLADRIGATFAARIGGVTRAGLFVRLAETGADGFVPASLIGDEYFRFDEGARSMTGSRSGTAYRLGDPVEVRLMEAAPFAGALRFEIVGTERRRGPADPKRGAGGWPKGRRAS